MLVSVLLLEWFSISISFDELEWFSFWSKIV